MNEEKIKDTFFPHFTLKQKKAAVISTVGSTGPDGTVVMSLANGLVSTGFTS